MVKSSWKSLEGQSLGGVVLVVLVVLYDLVTGDSSNHIPVDVLIEKATSATELAAAYKSDLTEGGWDTAKTGAILAFLYKMYDRFTAGRVELKKKEMEVKGNEADKK